MIDAVSAAILPVWVDFTSLKGLGPCAPGPATTRRGMLVTNGYWLGLASKLGLWLGLYALRRGSRAIGLGHSSENGLPVFSVT